jgi:hypothetical protein
MVRMVFNYFFVPSLKSLCEFEITWELRSIYQKALNSSIRLLYCWSVYAIAYRFKLHHNVKLFQSYHTYSEKV